VTKGSRGKQRGAEEYREIKKRCLGGGNDSTKGGGVDVKLVSSGGTDFKCGGKEGLYQGGGQQNGGGRANVTHKQAHGRRCQGGGGSLHQCQVLWKKGLRQEINKSRRKGGTVKGGKKTTPAGKRQIQVEARTSKRWKKKKKKGRNFNRRLKTENGTKIKGVNEFSTESQGKTAGGQSNKKGKEKRNEKITAAEKVKGKKNNKGGSLESISVREEEREEPRGRKTDSDRKLGGAERILGEKKKNRQLDSISPQQKR